MIIADLDYHEPFKQNIGILGGFDSFIPIQTFSQEKFLDDKLVASFEVSYVSRANGIRSANTMVSNVSQTAETVDEGFVSRSSSSVAAMAR